MGNQHFKPMIPGLVLTLWRDRWRKEAGSTRRVPYLQGKVNEWGDQLTHNNAWSMPVIELTASFGCLMIFLLTTGVALTTPTQILFSTCLVCTALYLRRYEGMLITLILAGMSLLASARYLNWRFSAIFDQAFSLASLLALGLCLAELYLWIVTTLNYLTTIWPLKRVSVPLPADTADWPTVDVLITVRGRSLKDVQHVASAVLALEWPTAKLKTYLVDDRPQAEIKEFAKKAGLSCLVLNDAPHDEAGIINWAASRTEGSLIAVFQCDQPPSPGFLTKAVGWFIKDPKLGMIQTPLHFLASKAVGDRLGIFVDEEPGISCALIRRSALSPIDKADSNEATLEPYTPIHIKGQGYGSAFIMFASSKIGGYGYFSKSRGETDPSASLFLVDNQTSESDSLWKRRLNSLQEFFNFYFFVPQFIFFTAPLAYILGGIDIFQTTPSLLLAYFMPHLTHAYFLNGRLENRNRLTIWGDLKEAVLAWYLLFPTAGSLLSTELGRIRNLFRFDKKAQKTILDWITAWSYGVFISLNLVGFVFGIQHGFTSGTFENLTYLLCFTWVLCNLLFLVAALAIEKESRYLWQHTQQQLQQAAMIQLPSGRTITGVTEDFPDLLLTVSLPTRPKLDIGTIIGLSIFRGQEETTFTAKVTVNCDQCFRITISESSRHSYQALGTIALLRDEHGPKWLPGRDADQPFPEWLSKPFITALGKVLKIAKKFALPSKVNFLSSWIKYWEKTT
jgi:cellulose synthase (UDP-forming)